ncbi:MAG: energy transducer TonB [Pyrinomonadaceae bacterium]|nr:energy transducer TonB [Pyrinomonadaceae bacterium]
MPSHFTTCFVRTALTLILAVCAAGVAAGQRVAIVVPETNGTATRFAERLQAALAESGLTILDRSAAGAAFGSAAFDAPYNLTVDQARRAGEVIGSDILILIKAQTQSRTSLERIAYPEAAAAIFVVSGRTGRLLGWENIVKDSGNVDAVETSLVESSESVAASLLPAIREGYRRDLAKPSTEKYPELPAEGSAEAKGLRTPIPYNRIKPVYTPEAFLFGVKATVDAEASIDANGNVTEVDIVRWAGYGLDESVVNAIRSMNWRPAERNGKPLPMRILLRYNFTKTEKTLP